MWLQLPLSSQEKQPEGSKIIGLFPYLSKQLRLKNKGTFIWKFSQVRCSNKTLQLISMQYDTGEVFTIHTLGQRRDSS